LTGWLTTGRSAYDGTGEHPARAYSLHFGWRQAYDLFEITGPNAKTEQLMRLWVIPRWSTR